VQGEQEVGQISTDAERLHEFAERYTAAWCSLNPASVAGFFAPDGSLRVNQRRLDGR
jgi:hypothetical protein